MITRLRISTAKVTIKKEKNNITMTITIKKMMMPICPFSESHNPALLDKMHPFCRTTLHHTVPPRLRKHVGEGVEAERGERGERGERRGVKGEERGERRKKKEEKREKR